MTDDNDSENDERSIVPESNYDRDIQPGDIVRDLWSGKKLYVTSIEATTAAEWDKKQSDGSKSILEYEGSIGTDARQSDTVYRCVFLKSNASFSAGSKDYDYPESRLARFAHESANGDDLRTQDRIRATAFAELMAAFESDNLEEQIRGAWNDEIATLSRELYESRYGGEQMELVNDD